MKIVKGNTPYRFITGDDVVITKNSEEKGEIVTVDNVLDEHKKEIDKLKSNMKYIYSYGGVGGNGRGGSGQGSSTTPASLYISLNGIQIQSGQDNVIVLPKKGKYELFMNVSNSGGNTFYVDYSYGENIDVTQTVALSTDRNKCKKSINLDLYSNGKIKILFYDEDSILGSIEQDYIVESHTFDINLMYVFDNEDKEFNKQNDGRYEYFIGNPIYQNPFVSARFKIGLSNVTNITLKYQIGDTDGEDNNILYESIEDNPITTGSGIVHYGSRQDITNNPLKIYLGNLQRNGVSFISGSNMGTYTVSITLTYNVNNKETQVTNTYDMTLIPSDLYINVRNPEGLIYDTEDDLINDLNNVEEGQELEKSVSIGAYSSYYCKVFEGPMRSTEQHYDIIFNTYNYVNGEYVLYKTSTVDGVIEQREMARPFSVAFDTDGIKKLEFITEHKKIGSSDNPTIKYIYVKKSSSKQIDWYPNITQKVFYFRANTSEPYSDHFPYLEEFGNNPIELSESSSPLTITDDNWTQHEMNLYDATILSFGMQYNAVNTDDAKIFDTYDYGENTPNMTMYSTSLFEKQDSINKKIFIPTESNFDKTVSSQYHLVQIVRYKLGYVGEDPQYATYLYIDGVIESNDSSITTHKYDINKIVLNNVNVVYNMISIQYLNVGSENSIDGLVYQSWLAYKERMHVGEITEAERVIFNNLRYLKFDGSDLVVPESFVKTSAKVLEIPTMMAVYTGGEDTYESFTRSLFKGYKAGASDEFDPTVVDLWWSPGLAELENIPVPQNGVFDDETQMSYHGHWQIDLQGTSTMRNKIKNFSLSIVTDSDLMKILMSPNYDPNDPTTFLPENEWTLKADIADSAHANNTSVGKFVNRNCTRFSTSNGITGSYKNYIKNTLEGFPFLMYFQIGPKIYYLGVYNFNMGRQSQYNLGYHSEENTNNMIKNLNEINAGINRNSPFKFSVGGKELINGMVVAEVQENYSEFDFHQYDRSVLFQTNDSSYSKMFGKKKDMTYADYDRATVALENFTYSVAKAGAYCFSKIGKEAVISNSRGINPETNKPYVDGDCSKVYNKSDNPDGTHTEYVPDVKWQFYYDNNDRKVWYQDPGVPGKDPITFENVSGDLNNLLQCITNKNKDDVIQQAGYDYLDFTSASEYYTVCMAFGLVDSILKNLNVKSWDAHKFYVAFYDMDCAFGENNAGEEKISYLASTDYWYSENNNGYLKSADVIYDYWPKDNKDVGNGFDYSSSYLFAIAKYAQAILNKFNETLPNPIVMNNYPQQFWAKLRRPKNVDDSLTGQLCNADYFINKYFSSGIGKIPAILASLNYQVKYLYFGTVYDEETGEEKGETYIANEHAFNGSRICKVKDWLNKRLHFLDLVFNIQGISMPIGGGYMMPSVDSTVLTQLSANPDIILMSDMFTLSTNTTVLMDSISTPVSIWAPTNTPFIINRGESSVPYLLCAGTGKPNMIEINVNNSEPLRWLGSKEFTDISMVDPFLSGAKIIYSDKIEHIRGGKSGSFPVTSGGLNIKSSSVKTIALPISTYSGLLVINNEPPYGQELKSIDINNSGFYGSWERLKNLQEINISSIDCQNADIKISQCPLLTGEKCIISGSEIKPTKLKTLSLSGVSGKFVLEHTNIEIIEFSSAVDKVSDFEISGDVKLERLTLSGFRNIKIKDCPNLKTITISNSNKCQEFILDVPNEYINDDGSIPTGLIKFNDNEVKDESIVFDFTDFTSLKKLSLTGTNAVVIKIPNQKVSIKSFKNNKNLEFIDTSGRYSIIELTDVETFYNCPKYGMRQSWWSTDDDNTDGKNISTDSYTTNIGNAIVGNYTRMCISPDCDTLSNTFNKLNSSISTSYSSTPYKNSWGQYVKNQKINNEDAMYFINVLVGGKNIDDEYIDENNIIHDTSSQGGFKLKPSDYYDGVSNGGRVNCCPNIISLQQCFYMQDGIRYEGSIDADIPDLSTFTSLQNISMMYYGTSVTRLDSRILSLPESKNNNDSENSLNWYNFIKDGAVNISKDAFKNISYRISGLSNMILSIYGNGEDSSSNVLVNINKDEDGYFDIVDILCPQKDEYDNIIPFNRINEFNYFSVNSDQYVDYTNLFNVCPNVTTLIGFLNTDLSKSRLESEETGGMLKNCTKLRVIENSFNHSNSDMTSCPTIDLYNFFNWSEPSLFNSIIKLFDSTSGSIGFSINKRIDFNDFKSILNLLHNYTKIDSLSNIFSYCTIYGYDGTEEIEINVPNGTKMDGIKKVNALFYNCKSSDGEPLNIGRSFFKCLPNVVEVENTFGNVHFSNMLTYDFFCKRREEDITRNIYVKVNGEYKSEGVNLHTTSYGKSLITNMKGCFQGAKFYNCECWFNPLSEINIDLRPLDDVVTYNGNTYNEYYKKDSTSNYVKYDIHSKAYTDTLNNFTNYVSNVRTGGSAGGGSDIFNIQNHTISKDLEDFDIIGEPYITNNFNIYPTYCCLPPDILYCCSFECDLTCAFADTNIIGVIPQHLIKECYGEGCKLNNMFRNVNILPNLMYHYYSKYDNDSDYLELINNIEVDEELVSTVIAEDSKSYVLTEIDESLTGVERENAIKQKATVLFRNSNGELRRRRPIISSGSESPDLYKDYSKSQFVYVPQGYTTNRNLYQAFTFRYNLPAQVDLYQRELQWPTTQNNYYGIEYSEENRPDLWPYYTQYFFTVDESINWNRLYNMSSPFISDGDDISFDGNEVRVFSANGTSHTNRWWTETNTEINSGTWDQKTNGYFNSFLNLCGKRSTRTGQVKDNGFPIGDSLYGNNNYLTVSSLISGI